MKIATYPLAEPISPTWSCFWTIGSPSSGVTKTTWEKLTISGVAKPSVP